MCLIRTSETSNTPIKRSVGNTDSKQLSAAVASVAGAAGENLRVVSALPWTVNAAQTDICSDRVESHCGMKVRTYENDDFKRCDGKPASCLERSWNAIRCI